MRRSQAFAAAKKGAREEEEARPEEAVELADVRDAPLRGPEGQVLLSHPLRAALPRQGPTAPLISARSSRCAAGAKAGMCAGARWLRGAGGRAARAMQAKRSTAPAEIFPERTCAAGRHAPSAHPHPSPALKRQRGEACSPCARRSQPPFPRASCCISSSQKVHPAWTLSAPYWESASAAERVKAFGRTPMR